jgi:hypothetical protein
MNQEPSHQEHHFEAQAEAAIRGMLRTVEEAEARRHNPATCDECRSFAEALRKRVVESRPPNLPAQEQPAAATLHEKALGVEATLSWLGQFTDPEVARMVEQFIAEHEQSMEL